MVSRTTAVGVEMEDNGWPRETSEDGAGGSDGDGEGAGFQVAGQLGRWWTWSGARFAGEEQV